MGRLGEELEASKSALKDAEAESKSREVLMENLQRDLIAIKAQSLVSENANAEYMQQMAQQEEALMDMQSRLSEANEAKQAVDAKVVGCMIRIYECVLDGVVLHSIGSTSHCRFCIYHNES